MKVANIKSGTLTHSSTINSKINMDHLYMKPCYFADIERAEKRKDWVWRIGCKYENKKNEDFSFKMYKFGDVTDEKTWLYITSAAFAIVLIDTYRKDGEEGIRQIIRNTP
ncbi:MAG: hypothetical protein WC523_00075 [Patescibacteria group bacterium]